MPCIFFYKKFGAGRKKKVPPAFFYILEKNSIDKFWKPERYNRNIGNNKEGE